jgi:phospholipid transport system substrate-binding protein
MTRPSREAGATAWRRRSSPWLTLALLVAALPAAAQPAPAAQPGADPAAPIQALDAALIVAMKSAKTASFQARADALAPAIDAAFDLPGILKSTVGLQWASIPPAQQTQMLAAFRAFTIASYAGNFNSYDGQTITIVPPPRQVGADEIVQTTIVSDGVTNRIDYQMRTIDGVWKAEDVLLDGTISNVAVQRSDFRKLLATGDARKLIDSLNKRAADLQNGTAP